MNYGTCLLKKTKGNVTKTYFLTIFNFIFHSVQSLVVQRVSKTIFVVKCAVSNKFPLGFLHCSFIEARNKAGILERKFVCACRKLKPTNSSEIQHKECVHFYACILAFISEEKFMNEFSYHIQVLPYLALCFRKVNFLFYIFYRLQMSCPSPWIRLIMN